MTSPLESRVALSRAQHHQTCVPVSWLRAVTLGAHWPCGVLGGGASQELVDAVRHEGARPDEAWLDVSVNRGIAIEARASHVSAEALSSTIEVFASARTHLLRRLGAEAQHVDERTEIGLIADSGSISGATLRCMLSVAAPAFLLLLGSPGGRAITIAQESDRAMKIRVHHTGRSEALQGVIGVVFAFCRVLLRDAAEDEIPPTLLRFPDLVWWRTVNGIADIPQTTASGTPLLRRGRLTSLRARSNYGWVAVTAQTCLTTLYLYAEPCVRLLHDSAAQLRIRRAILGMGSLPSDLEGVRRLRPAPPPVGRAPRHSLRAPAERSRKTPPVIALIQAGGFNHVTSWIGTAVARRPDVRVVVCPWWAIRLDGLRARASGMVEYAGPSQRGLTKAYVEGLPVDMLYFDGIGGARRPRTPAERRGARQLARANIAHEGMTCRAMVFELLRRASQRGIVTNATISYNQWEPKGGLEFALRECERVAGVRVSRPTTYVALGCQAPAVLDAFLHQGADFIVKPSFGCLGRGIQTVSAVSETAHVQPVAEYVLQALVTNPLLIDARKLDLRCHLLIDADSRGLSRWIPPILGRLGATKYIPGLHDAENLNFSYQRVAGRGAAIAPLRQMTSIPVTVRRQIAGEVRALSERLIDAYFALQRGPKAPLDSGPRVFLWGFDVALSVEQGRVKANLLENNVRPQIYRNASWADNAMRRLVSEHHVGALLTRYRALRRDRRP